MIRISPVTKTLLAIVSTAVSLSAFSVKIVAPDGTPVTGVTATFAVSKAVLTSTNEGVITAPVDALPITQKNRIPVTSLSLQGEKLNFSLPSSGTVSLQLFGLNGRALFNHTGNYSAGGGSVAMPSLSDGVYILKGTVGNYSFTQKLIPSVGLNWSEKGSVPSANISSRAAERADAIDTVTFTKLGNATVSKVVTAYDQDLGTIVMTPAKNYGTWYGFQTITVDTANPSFVHLMFRTYDQNGYGRTSDEMPKFQVYEDGKLISTTESQFAVEKATTFDYSISTVLLIDNSASVKDSIGKIKNAAKTMIRAIGPKQSIAIYTFSSAPTMIQNFTSDTTALLAAIDKIIPEVMSTNLYGSLITALSRIGNSADVKNRKLYMGNVVLFTDGRETQNSTTLSALQSAQGTKQVYAIGLGADVDTTTLKLISRGQTYVTSSASDLGNIFINVQEEIAATAGSMWWAHYRSPTRGAVTHSINMKLTGNSNTSSDKDVNGQFSSKSFVDGWLPIAESLMVTLNATKDTLIGSYKYVEKDGRPEAATVIEWYVNGSKVGTGLKLAKTAIPANATSLELRVRPVAAYGTANIGLFAILSFGFLEITQPEISWSPVKDIYTSLDTVIITAKPAQPLGLKNWTEALTGSKNPEKLIITGYKKVGAVHDTLREVVVMGGKGSGTYVPAVTVAVTADDSSNVGKAFDHWGGTDSSLVVNRNSAKSTFSMPARPVDLKAVFVSGGYQTTVTNGTGSGLYVSGKTVTITANDSSSVKKIFDHWGGADSTLVVDKEAIASFVMPTKNVSISAVYRTLPVPVMVTIPAGTYLYQGTTSTSVKEFLMSKYEITQKEYQSVMGVNPSYFKTDSLLPVDSVTWFDALLYCNARSKAEGKDTVYTYTSMTGIAGNAVSDLAGLVIDSSKNGYYLPTDQQWEYACRGGTTTTYYWGNVNSFDATTMGKYAWYNSNSGSTTHQVGGKLPNTFGLYDMAGNVWEWDESLYVSNRLDRVSRGGSWLWGAFNLNSAERFNGTPFNRYSYIGFRVACGGR